MRRSHLLWFVISSSLIFSLTYSYHIIQKLTTTEIQHKKYCALECYLDINCISWNYYERNDNENTQLTHHCYLETIKYHELLQQENKTIPYHIGTENLFQHKRVLTGPVAIGRSTILNFDQSFVFGCSYTILTWAWIWKIPKTGGEMAVFTTRESLPYLRKHQALLPSVVFNLGFKKNNFFFSTIKDSSNDYEGTWGPEVEYNKWIHIAMVFVGDRMKIYINGREFSNLIMTKSSQYSDHSCPEDLSSNEYAKTHNLLNNTIFQIGGSRQGTMMGMVQHVDIFQGAALSPMQVERWMHLHRPSDLPTLNSLLSSSLTEISPQRINSDEFCGYESLNYDICPSDLCGNICLFENSSEIAESVEESHFGDDSDEIILDHNTYDNVENDIEVQIDLIGDSAFEDSFISGSDSLDSEDISDEELATYLIDGPLTEEEVQYLKDTLRQVRGSPMGDPYQDMSDEEVLKMWSAQSSAFFQDDQNTISSFITNSKWFTDSELSKDIGQEWQEMKKQVANFSNISEETRSSDIVDPDDSRSLIFNNSLLKDKLAQAAKRIFSSAEVKFQLESYVRNPYYRRGSLNTLQETQTDLNERNIEESSSSISNSSSTIWIFSELDQFMKIAQTTVSNLYQSLISNVQMTFYQTNLTVNNQTLVTPNSTNHTLKLLTNQMLEKLPNRDRYSPAQIDLISNWLESFLAKHTNGTDEAVSTFLSLLEGASFLLIDPALSDNNDESLPPTVPLITQLYDQAMLWYTGRHLVYNHTPSDHDFETILEKYLTDVSEPAQSALIYAMWLSDELELEYPDLVDNTYYFQTMTGMFGQPIRLALGYKTDSNMINFDSNIDFQQSIQVIIRGSPEYLAIGRARSVEFRPPSTNHSLLGNSPQIIESPEELEQSLQEYLDDLASRDEELSAQLMTPNDRTTGSFSLKHRHSLHLQSIGSCNVAGSYYLPIMKYVTTHFGDVETGVGVPDGVLLADLPSPDDIFMSMNTGGGGGGGRGGGSPTRGTTNSIVESTLREHYETEAAAGNADAQMWLGIRSYWGTSGLEANATTARKYFEKAAAQNHSEALFCLGALYENGQGGLARNRTKALHLFRLSAAQKTPWPAALQALGSYHWNNGPMEERNETLAMQYFQKAAEMGHANGYYSLGLMYRESSLTVAKQNIPLAVHLMSLAASLGHVRAMTNLAHAFFDVESWLGHYAREQLQIFRESNDIHDNITEVEASITGDTIQDVQSNDSEHSDDDLMTRWGYNSSSGMQVILTATSEVIRLPEPLRPDCSIALPLLKYMAEHTFRPNDLAKNGLKLFMAGDIWGALELYEEAADLGVTIAQENVAFLYQLISEKYCPKSRKGNSFQLSTRWHTKSWKFLSQFKKNYTRWMNDLTSTFPFLKFWSSTEQKNQTRSDSEHRMKFRGYDKILNSPSCSDYFHDMALIRWIQVAKSGDVEALRKLAHQYQETDSITQSVLNFQSSKNRLRKNNTKAALLYAIAASEHGDISSIISLGWFIQQGIAGVEKNLTLAKLLYQKASELEAVYSKYGLSWATTQGIAPFLANFIATIELWFLQLNSIQQWYKFVLDDYQLVYSLVVVLFFLGLVRYYRQLNR